MSQSTVQEGQTVQATNKESQPNNRDDGIEFGVVPLPEEAHSRSNYKAAASVGAFWVNSDFSPINWPGTRIGLR